MRADALTSEPPGKPNAVEKSMKRRKEWKRKKEEGWKFRVTNSQETVMGKVTAIPGAVA